MQPHSLTSADHANELLICRASRFARALNTQRLATRNDKILAVVSFVIRRTIRNAFDSVRSKYDSIHKRICRNEACLVRSRELCDSPAPKKIKVAFAAREQMEDVQTRPSRSPGRQQGHRQRQGVVTTNRPSLTRRSADNHDIAYNCRSLCTAGRHFDWTYAYV